MEFLHGLRKVLDGIDNWLILYPNDDGRFEMWKHRHTIIEGITDLQIKFFNRD